MTSLVVFLNPKIRSLKCLKKKNVQYLGIPWWSSVVRIFTAEGAGSIPGQGTKILRAM